MMWSDAHRWVTIPHTKSERRREDAVREKYFTAITFPRKYFDIDTGKFIKDKIPTIESCALHEIFSEDPYSNGNCDRHYFYRGWRRNTTYEPHEPEKQKFIPQDRYYDDDFEPEPVKVSDEEFERKISEAENRIKKYNRQQEYTTSNLCVGYVMKNKWIPK